MLYNVKDEKVQTTCSCVNCKYYNDHQCKGIGKICFIYDDKTRTLIDPVTNLPISLEVAKRRVK